MPGLHVRGRRAVIAVSILIGALLAPGVVAAGQLIRSFDDSTALNCSASGASGSAFVSINKGGFGDFAAVAIFPLPSDPNIDPPTYFEDDAATAAITLVGGVLDATVPMLHLIDPINFGTEPAQSAMIHAVLAASGPPIVVNETFQNGNRKFRVTGSYQPITATGTVVEPEADLGSFTLHDCVGQVNAIATTETSPATSLQFLSYVTANCTVPDENGSDGELFVHGSLFGATFLYTQGGTGAQFFGSGPQLTTTGMAGSLDWFNTNTGENAGSGSVDVTLTATRAVHKYVQTGQFSTSTVTETILSATGTVTTFDGAVFNLAACPFATVLIRGTSHSPGGPKPGGAAPVNDLPANAIPLARGTTKVSTRGAEPTPEAACIDPASGFETFIGRTVWYTISGSGAPVTIDTAGTAFDTVIGVYDGNTSNEIACVDDVQQGISRDARTIQAAVTFTAQAGHTYLIQIGGFDNQTQPVGGEYGTLVISRR